MDERSPAGAHQEAQVLVRLGLVGVGVDSSPKLAVAETLRVVEDESDFHEVRDAGGERNAVGDGVEAVAVSVDAVGGPGFTGAAAVGDHDCITPVGG